MIFREILPKLGHLLDTSIAYVRWCLTGRVWDASDLQNEWERIYQIIVRILKR
jgi:hypothetical protein